MLAVLVIERDPLTRETLVHMVEAAGHTAVGAAEPHIALGLLEKAGFHVIVVSLKESDPDGREIALNAKSICPSVKVLVISGAALEDELSKDVDAFVRKPFDIPTIERALQDVTGWSTFGK